MAVVPGRLIQRGEAATALKSLWYKYGDAADEESSTLPGSSLAQFCSVKASAAGGSGRALFCEAIDKGAAAHVSPMRVHRSASSDGRDALVVLARNMCADERISSGELRIIEARVAKAEVATSPNAVARRAMEARAVNAVDEARVSHLITTKEAEIIERKIRLAMEAMEAAS